ncbi:MAG: type II toxin-antitoxin system prevent-host-death family antitoxin [Chloroflexi bacterium]|nr:type II toxin-antitoxin system prevent-host-death family antitoxin [Chloroflexota bacterium]
MSTVGVRELKIHASHILRRVRAGEVVDVTHRGRVVARLLPVGPAEPSDEEAACVWADLDQLAAEIGACWPADATAADAVREGRREL